MPLHSMAQPGVAPLQVELMAHHPLEAWMPLHSRAVLPGAATLQVELMAHHTPGGCHASDLQGNAAGSSTSAGGADGPPPPDGCQALQGTSARSCTAGGANGPPQPEGGPALQGTLARSCTAGGATGPPLPEGEQACKGLKRFDDEDLNFHEDEARCGDEEHHEALPREQKRRRLTGKTADPSFCAVARRRLAVKTTVRPWHFANQQGSCKRRRLTAKTAAPGGSFAGLGRRDLERLAEVQLEGN